jgi:hypothetical protein
MPKGTARGAGKGKAPATKCRNAARTAAATPPDAPPQPSTVDLVALIDAVADKVTQRLTNSATILAPPPATIPQTPLAATNLDAPVMNAAVASILGESGPASAMLPANLQPQLSAPLGAHVPAQVRAKIWAGQFVEMSELLPPPTYPERRPPQKQPQHPAPIRIQDFASAFHAFIVIRTERFPGDAPGMLKHLETVQTMSRNFGSQAWLHYDRGFRWAMQHNPAIQWGSLDVELYMQATALGLKGERNYSSNYSRPSQRRTDKLSGPPKTCWRFYRDGKCPH